MHKWQMRLVFSYLTTPGKNFIYQHVDKMDISENQQFFKGWKTGILTEFLCNCVSTFLITCVGMFYSTF